MKEREICPFAMKMIREEFEVEEIMDHMKECSVCQDIGDKLISYIEKDLGLDLKPSGQF